MKPMLASPVDLESLSYPVLCTPKLDGIRCLTVYGTAMSRSMKPIPNRYVQEVLRGLHGLDGELMVSGDFNDIESAIMKRDGKPEFEFWVFDTFHPSAINLPYEERISELALDYHFIDFKVLLPKTIRNENELLTYLEECVSKGYEGVMIRKPDGPYKQGRSTVKEGYLLKLKKFFDDEAVLVDVIEKMHNANELERDELGYAKRSSKKNNLIPTGTAGSCILSWKGVKFKVGFGPGITDKHKQDIWDNRYLYFGSTVKFRYQEVSKYGIPRFGKFLCFRHDDDLGE